MLTINGTVTDSLPVVEGKLDTHMAGDSDQMDRTVAGGTNGGGDHDGIFERLARHDLRRFQVFPNHFDDALAAGIGHLGTLPIRGGDGGAAGKRHAKRLGQRVHGRGRAHGIAVADARSGRRHQLHEALAIDLAGGKKLTGAPFDGA
jgi:hypothetical protein